MSTSVPRAVMKVCVLLELETSDPRIDPAMIGTVSGTKALREAVLEALPSCVTRVVALVPTELAEVMMQAHDEVATTMGNPPGWPPRGYKAPNG